MFVEYPWLCPGLLQTASHGTDRQTNRQTDGHCNLVTESAHWRDTVKIYKVMKLFGGGSIINGATPSSLVIYHYQTGKNKDCNSYEC